MELKQVVDILKSGHNQRKFLTKASAVTMVKFMSSMQSILRMIEAGTQCKPLTFFPDLPKVSEAVQLNWDELDCLLANFKKTGWMFLKQAKGLMGMGQYNFDLIYDSKSLYV